MHRRENPWRGSRMAGQSIVGSRTDKVNELNGGSECGRTRVVREPRKTFDIYLTERYRRGRIV